MKKRVIVLSGQICAGKTTVAQSLGVKLGIEVLDTIQLVADSKSKSDTQEGNGRSLEQLIPESSDSKWLGEILNQRMWSRKAGDFLVIDSVLVPEQIPYLRRSGWAVTHVHLEAPEQTRRERFALRDSGNAMPFDE